MVDGDERLSDKNFIPSGVEDESTSGRRRRKEVEPMIERGEVAFLHLFKMIKDFSELKKEDEKPNEEAQAAGQQIAVGAT